MNDMKKFEKNDIFYRIKILIESIIGKEVEFIDERSEFMYSIEMDSMDYAELVDDVEFEFGVKLPDTYFITVGEMVDYIYNNL